LLSGDGRAKDAKIIILAMRSFLRFLWMSLVLVIVALLSALVAMRLAVHRREVSVPDMRGKSPVEARHLAEERELVAVVEREYYSPTVPAGKVVSQAPDPETVVRTGWEVRLALSLGPQQVVIPELVGQSERAATMTVDERGLEISSIARAQMPGTADGLVIGQAPPANATHIPAPRVSLLVAQAPSPESYVTPNFAGQVLGSVTNILKAAGFSVGNVTVSAAAPGTGNPGTQPPAALGGNAGSRTGEAGQPQASNFPTPSPASIIVSQDPAPGQKIPAGAAINFVVR
jgi:beta-lactam-binding protein with PASTA domain